jgi:hypothetical protein
MSRKSIFDRFESRYEPITESGCWIWTAHLNKDGYGIPSTNGKHVLAHRLSWIKHRGQIPKGFIVCHKCDVTSCVNPDHLFLVTHQDNIKDKIKKVRQFRKLSAKDASEIRACKGTLQSVAKRFGISAMHVSNIRKKRFLYEAEAGK